ncbi:MAG TPA: ribbon-helix-helix protein, CopG family [Polyangiaceae bacterium]|jgi:transcriptional regulator of met regulon
MKAARVTVSVPAETFASVERTRRQMRKTRSAVVSEALAEWLSRRDVPEADRRYAEAYLRQPENPGFVEPVAAGAVGEWDAWE